MLTIHEAKETPYGRATWLLDLVDEHPHVRLPCPFKDPDSPKKELKGKDWTKYGGHLYSDHSIRREFFLPSPDKPQHFKRSHWLEDFVYLFSPTVTDHQ